MFRYHMPTELYFGKRCLNEQGSILKKYGKKALIVTGRDSARKSGALGDLEEELAKQDISYTLYSEITENPKLESIVAGAKLLIKQECDFVVGIGGGSPIDAAKAISVVAANDISGNEIYNPKNLKKSFPIIAIPTTSGTGTEATQYSVITDGTKKAGFGSPLIFPSVSFLDPAYTVTMPAKVTRDTAIDALSHLLEGFYSNKRCPLVYPFIMSGVKIIYTTLQKAIEEPENFEYRKQLMCASLYGGTVIAQSSTTLQHSIGYPLTTHYGLSHGLANGVVMKHIMELYYPAVKNELNLLFAHLNCSKQEFYNWLEVLGMNISLNLESNFVSKAAAEIAGSRNMGLNPIDVSLEQIESILHSL